MDVLRPPETFYKQTSCLQDPEGSIEVVQVVQNMKNNLIQS